MISREKINDARRLLQELKAVLEIEGESNCIRGVIAAGDSLRDSDDEQGFGEARSIYKTMAEGRGPLSEFYIERPMLSKATHHSFAIAK